MASASTSCLLAILLVTQARTGTGAQIVFHYPPNPFSNQEAQGKGTASSDDDESSSSDSDSQSSSDDNGYHSMLRQTKPSTQLQYSERPQISDDDEEYRDAETKTQDQRLSKPPWEPLLGLGEEGLVSLLAPGRAWHKRKFEMGINDFVFVGRPVYSKENGTWRRGKRSRIPVHVEPEQEQPSDTATESEPEQLSNSQADVPLFKSPPKRHSGRKSSLTMFHVVFVLQPPPLEHTVKVKEIYDNIVRKFSKILTWEQANHEYVWKQSDLIQGIKSTILPKKASVQTLYAELLARSSLAGAISTIFKSITASRIAAVQLGSDMSTSLQIPPTTSVSYLPSLTDPPIQPGLWLTTANDSLTTDSDLDTATAAGALQLAKRFSLLLTESPQKIVKEIQSTGGPLATPVSTFIDKARPTKSFYKISVANQISLADIQLLSRHLIYWRRAIAIPPLHHRDTYIVSPNADMSKLVEASKSFEMAFPMMPSLPRFLSLLSQAPVPFGTLIPSSDHKEEYYRVLAWLMRGGWVTQLRTFAFIRVDPTVKKAVREKGREERNQHIQTSSPDKSDPDHQHFAPTPPSRRPSVPSRHSSDGRHSISTSTSQSQSQSQSQKPSSLAASPSMASIHTSSLILSPLRASTLESKYLTAIADSLLTTSYSSSPLTQTEKEELRKYWPTLVKYFNGSEPLEMLPIREGLKRKFVWDVLGRLGLRFEGGVNDEKGEKGGILVTVRHW